MWPGHHGRTRTARPTRRSPGTSTRRAAPPSPSTRTTASPARTGTASTPPSGCEVDGAALRRRATYGYESARARGTFRGKQTARPYRSRVHTGDGAARPSQLDGRALPRLPSAAAYEDGASRAGSTTRTTAAGVVKIKTAPLRTDRAFGLKLKGTSAVGGRKAPRAAVTVTAPGAPGGTERRGEGTVRPSPSPRERRCDGTRGRRCASARSGRSPSAPMRPRTGSRREPPGRRVGAHSRPRTPEPGTRSRITATRSLPSAGDATAVRRCAASG